jgi:hypothetical protein
MKTLPFLVASLTLLLCGACDHKSAPPATDSTSTPNKASSAQSPDLRTEASNAAQKTWAMVWIQSGDTWTTQSKVIDTGLPAMGGPFLFQIKGPKIQVSTQPLSEANRLNGVQWIGTIELFSAAERKCQLDSGRSAGWGSWSTRGRLADGRPWPVDSVELRKENGQWIVTSPYPSIPNGYTNTEAVRPSISPLPE